VDEQTMAAPPAPATTTVPTTPTVLPRAVVLLLGAAAAVIVTAGLKAAAGIAGPVLLALVLTLAVSPLGAWARRHGWPSLLATLLVIVAAYAIVLALAFGLAYSLVKLAEILPAYADDAADLTQRAQDQLSRLGLADQPTGTALGTLDLGRLVDAVTGLLSTTLGVLGNLFFLVTLLFFLTAESATWSRGPGAGVRSASPALADALQRFTGATRTYLLVCAGFGAVVAVLDGAALWLLGIPLPWAWALLSFLTNFVPNIGFVIGVIPPALLGLLEGGWGGLLSVVLVYSVLNVVIQTFIQPRFIGDAVDLSTAVTFLSVAFWTFVLGPLGALLAVPMTLLVKALLVDPDPRARVAEVIMSAPRRARA
jgi:predicted PurR-regulated permease PerM